MNKKQKNLVTFAACFVIFASLGGGLATANSFDAPEQIHKQKLTVRLSSEPRLRAEQAARLAQVDVLGKDKDSGLVYVYVSATEAQMLREAQFEVVAFDALEAAQMAGIEKYLNPSKVVAELEALEKRFPSLARTIEIGKTTSGRPILAIEISSDFNDPSRPAILYNAMHHARELMTAELGVSIAKTLLEGFGADSEITQWLSSYRVVVVPQVNPDGNDIVHNSNRMWRKNAWKDGRRVTGVDLNRNYSTLWNYCNGSSGTKTSDTYRGPSAASEPEVKAMMDLVKQVRPVFNISYHSFSELILYPFGCSDVENSATALYQSVGTEMKNAIIDDQGRAGTYELGTPPELLYQADGNDIDWQWREAGVISFAMEINSAMQGFQPDYDRWREVTLKRQEGGWKALLRRMGRGAIRANAQGLAKDGKVTYLIDTVKHDGKLAPWTDSNVNPFEPRNASGLIYQILEPGRYQVRFFADGKAVKSVAVTVGDTPVDLGEL